MYVCIILSRYGECGEESERKMEIRRWVGAILCEAKPKKVLRMYVCMYCVCTYV